MRHLSLLLVYIPLTVLFAFTALLARSVRYCRRTAGKMPRIMHGPTPMVALAYRAAADRHFGYQSDVVVRTAGNWGYRYLEMSEFDQIIENSPQHLLVQRTKGFLKVMFQYDILVTFFDGTFFRDGIGILGRVEFRLLKLAGIRIVTVSYGKDVVRYDVPAPRFDWVNQEKKDYPPRDINEHNLQVRTNVQRLSNVSDLVIAGDYSLSPLHPHDLVFKYFPIDCDEWQPHYETGNSVPVVVHAPNHRHCKGTERIIAACERLEASGYQLELQLVEGVDRNKVADIYRSADIVLDQILMGVHGLTGLEGLALGKPVLTYLNQVHLRDPSCNNGIVNTNPDNIDEVLKAVVSIPALRNRLGRNGRKAAEQYHSYEALGEVWDRIYRHLWFGNEMDLQTTRHFSPSRQPRSLSEDPCDEDFWPVPVTDLIGEIRAAVAAPPLSPKTATK